MSETTGVAELFLVETRDGVELVPYQPDFVAQIEAMERAARADRDVLRGLARPKPAAGRVRSMEQR